MPQLLRRQAMDRRTTVNAIAAAIIDSSNVGLEFFAITVLKRWGGNNAVVF